MIHGNLACETARVVTAQKGAAIRVYADAEIAHSDFHSRPSHDVRYRSGNSRVYLRRVKCWRVWSVVERD